MSEHFRPLRGIWPLLLLYSTTPLLLYSTTPLLHYSSTPLLHYRALNANDFKIFTKNQAENKLSILLGGAALKIFLKIQLKIATKNPFASQAQVALQLRVVRGLGRFGVSHGRHKMVKICIFLWLIISGL